MQNIGKMFTACHAKVFCTSQSIQGNTRALCEVKVWLHGESSPFELHLGIITDSDSSTSNWTRGPQRCGRLGPVTHRPLFLPPPLVVRQKSFLCCCKNKLGPVTPKQKFTGFVGGGGPSAAHVSMLESLPLCRENSRVKTPFFGQYQCGYAAKCQDWKIRRMTFESSDSQSAHLGVSDFPSRLK